MRQCCDPTFVRCLRSDGSQSAFVWPRSRYDACGRCSVAGRNNTDRSIWELVKSALDKCDHEITLLVESCDTVAGCGAWIAQVADLWRVSQDIEASWQSVMHNLDAQNAMAAVARPGHFNDPGCLTATSASAVAARTADSEGRLAQICSRWAMWASRQLSGSR